jgi:hypothetical protein
MKIFTTRGLVEKDQLQITDITTWEDNARVTATEWRLNGELVRRDVHVNILRGLEMAGAQANL